MEIGDGNAVGGAGGDDLLRRMQEAHDREVEEVDGAGAFDEARESALDGGPEEADRGESVDESDPVEGRVLETARRALEGEIESPERARGEVVETIVQERYSGMIDESNRDALVQSVKDSLADDVAFQAEVDDMLMHAARRLGRENAA